MKGTRKTAMLLLLAAGISMQGPRRAEAFAYTGDDGPAYWDELDLANEDCSASDSQSPIDIPRKTAAGSDAIVLALQGTPIHLTNTGHNLEQEYEPGSTVTLNGVAYDLQQFHFHTLSEHTIKGKRYPMELHAVFQNPLPPGDRVVIAVLFTTDRSGAENAFLATFPSLPAKQTDPPVTSLAEIDLGDLLTPAQMSSYFTYAGSLTTPPCSDDVTWVILKKPVKASFDQLEDFRGIVGNNFRPLQELNGRTVHRH